LPPVMDKLDTELILSMDPHDTLSEELAKFNIRSAIYTSFEHGVPHFNFFHKIREGEDRNILLFLKNMDAVEHNNILRVRGSTEAYRRLVETVSLIVKLPSAVIMSLWLEKGRFYANILFNHQVIDEVSSALMDHYEEGSHIAIEYLGDSGGFKTILSQIDQRSGIMMCQLTLTPPEGELIGENNPIGNSWTRIMKFPMVDNELSCVYFTDHIIEQGGGMLRLQDHIYEAETSNIFLHDLEIKLSQKRLPVESRINILKDGNFFYLIAFPSIFRDEFVLILTEIFREEGQWHPTLTGLRKFGDWVDEFL
jgi:hypothetical protein